MLEVHVFGAAKGESILIRMPDDRWGMIDCYAGKADDPATNHALQYAVASGVKSLDFLCMSHPHDDHYAGLHQVFAALPVREFWSPAVCGANMLRAMLCAKHIQAASGTLPKQDLKSLDQLAAQIREFCDRRRNAKERTEWAKLNIDSTLGRPTGWPSGFSIVGFGPSSDQARAYERRLEKCFDLNDHFVGTHQDHNLCSVGLAINWNRTRVILGGDIERPGWEDAMNRCPDKFSNATLVKLAHHGSMNGRADGLWQMFGNPKAAVVTAYASSSLPQRETLEEAGRFTQSIYTTSRLASAQLPGPTRPQYVLLRHCVGVGSLRDSSSFGRCSFELDDDGNIVRKEMIGTAQAI